MEHPPPQTPKLPYEKPELIVYGDIHAITHAVKVVGNPDHGNAHLKSS
jgi:hypothetical protein